MSDPYYGEIKMIGFPYAPRHYALCNGQSMDVLQNQALFSLLGTAYGGDGKVTFSLPDLQGRAPIHSNNGSPGPHLSAYRLGEKGGLEYANLREDQMPLHDHAAAVSGGSIKVHCNNSGTPDSDTPEGNFWSSVKSGSKTYKAFNTAPDTNMNPSAVTIEGLAIRVGKAGESMPCSMMQPYLAINFVIALAGTYPPRN